MCVQASHVVAFFNQNYCQPFKKCYFCNLVKCPYYKEERMKYLYWICVGILIWGITSCASSKSVPYMIDVESIPAEVLNAATPQPSPILAPGDILDISVMAKNHEVVVPFNKRLMQGEAFVRGTMTTPEEFYLVDQNGDIDFPVLGKLHVGGKSKTEVSMMIQEALYPKYLSELPQVSVWIQNFSVSVLGDVNRPGMFTIQNERVSVLDAIALAGDLAITGRRDNVLLVRVNADGTKQIARINLNDKNLISSPYFYLQQNDVLYVQPNKSKANSAVVVPPTTSLVFSATSILLTIANLIITAWSISK